MTEPKHIGSFVQVGHALGRAFSGVAREDSFIADFFEVYHHQYIEEPMTGCWLWIGSQTAGGYGNLTCNGRSFYAHRCSYEAKHGRGSSVNGVVRHRCDNPSCINPDHLIIGQPVDNANDAWSRGRMRPAKGERHPKAVLTEKDVVSIRRRAALGEPICDIAADFSVGWTAIDAAVTGESWPHLPGAIDRSAITKKPSRPPRRKGSEAHNAILTEAAVAEIKRRLRAGEKGRALAAEFGVSPVTVSAINVGRIWAHVS